MQFTPQQLAGGSSYSHKTKIGNWCEEVSLEEAKLQQYLQKKRSGTLLTAQEKIKKDTSMQAVAHSYNADGKVRFGDSLKLQNAATGGVLGASIFEKIKLDGEVFAVTAAPAGSETATTPCARSLFVIQRWPGHDYDDPEDDVLRYGQPFMIACNPALRRAGAGSALLKPLLYLSSFLVGPNRFAKLSNHQEVSLVGSAENGKQFSMVWKASRVANRRYQARGAPIMAGEPLIITNTATGAPLACDPAYKYSNDFGTEYEVAAHNYLKLGKTLNMIHEAKGICTADVQQRTQQNQNVWSFVLGEASAVSQDSGSASFSEMDANTVLAGIRSSLGASGVEELSKAFAAIDNRGNGSIDSEEFKWALSDFGIRLDDLESSILLRAFTTQNGAINVHEFLHTLKV